ncbi:MAG: 1,4-alpha-glucan branching protein GlgB [Planctomycetia bacterium]|nr:1,4-alpha-glucan branching protein GlgB [Planctomycetia bacterium]
MEFNTDMEGADPVNDLSKKSEEKMSPNFLSDFDLHLLGEGRHWRSYNKLGAQLCSKDGVPGVNFVVWAPNASEVCVAGDFNEWRAQDGPLTRITENGYWERFVPGATPGMLYKYYISANGQTWEKCDPYAFGSECPPKTASKIVDLKDYSWNDKTWLENRRNFDWRHKPISIYEVHLGSWRKNNPADKDDWMNYREIADKLVAYVKEMGFTHIEVLPVCEHPLTASWGYQITGYYAPTARYGSPQDFMYFVDTFHQNGIGVILDWVPAHFPKDAKGLGRFDGTALYEHEDARRGEHRDWGTYIFNYGRNEVRNFLISNAMYWADKYHVDGLRVDAVASMLYLDYGRSEGDWLPNEYGGNENIAAINFLKEMNHQVQTTFPGFITVAEESTAWQGVTQPDYSGGLGFCLKWNMGWMHDSLAYMRRDPVYRKYHQDQLTFSMMYAFSENFVLPFSHDEVVHCKSSMLGRMPGDLWQKFANLRLLYGYMWTHPGKKLLFMGGEIGQWNEWNFETELQWELAQYPEHKGLMKCVADLNKLYAQYPALYEMEHHSGGFQWIDCSNREMSTLSYLRKGMQKEDYLVVVCNFTPAVRQDFWIGVPEPGEYEEIFNSDRKEYAGSGVINEGVSAYMNYCQGQPATLRLTLPPLAMIVLKKKQ